MTKPSQKQAKSQDASSVGRTAEALPLPIPGGSREIPEDQPTPAQGSKLQPDTEEKAKFTEDVHLYISEYIKLADQKATFFFAGGTALLAFLYKNDISKRWLKSLMEWNTLDTVAFVAMTALAISALLSLLVIIPRTSGSGRGYVFWGAIAEYDHARQYADDIALMTSENLIQAKAEHCFDLARICRSKYRHLRISLWIGAVGLFTSLILFLFE